MNICVYISVRWKWIRQPLFADLVSWSFHMLILDDAHIVWAQIIFWILFWVNRNSMHFWNFLIFLELIFLRLLYISYMLQILVLSIIISLFILFGLNTHAMLPLLFNIINFSHFVLQIFSQSLLPFFYFFVSAFHLFSFWLLFLLENYQRLLLLLVSKMKFGLGIIVDGVEIYQVWNGSPF